MASATTWYWAMEFWLRPVGGLQVEYNDVGKMLAVFVLSAKDEKLASLPQTCSVSCISCECKNEEQSKCTYPCEPPECLHSCLRDSTAG